MITSFQMRAARAKLVEAYSATVKQYTMDGKIAQAKAVQQELDEFKKGSGLAAGNTDEKWMPLFNGRDLRGWKQHPESTGKWNVENGAIVGGFVSLAC